LDRIRPVANTQNDLMHTQILQIVQVAGQQGPTTELKQAFGALITVTTQPLTHSRSHYQSFHCAVAESGRRRKE
jgi:predicted ATPase